VDFALSLMTASRCCCASLTLIISMIETSFLSNRIQEPEFKPKFWKSIRERIRILDNII
jgi:hypothetical protein